MIKTNTRQTPGDAKMFSLHRYFLWATHMNVLFMALLREKGQIDLMAWTTESIKAFEYMSYWYAGLFVVVEGWQNLGLHDSILDKLLASPNVRLLKQFRNAVFHYQKNFLNQQFVKMVHEGQNAEAWVRELDREFERYFRSWFKKTGQPIPEV